MGNCAVTVVIPTYQRPHQLLEALEKILDCEPQPDEVIVHIDGDDATTETILCCSRFQEVKVIRSNQQVGPGGGRNKAIAEARNELVASFDDDSYPIDSSYFARLIWLFQEFPEAAVIGSAIYHRHEAIAPDAITANWVSNFVGCGCAYRRSVFQQTSGYVQLPVAYGMEEVDLSLRLFDMQWKVLESTWLRVFHDTELAHHNAPHITAASISNQALLAYLRYPFLLWWLGIGQCLSRVMWLARHQRTSGIFTGLLMIPQIILQNKEHRQAVRSQSLFSYLRLRRNTVSASFQHPIA
jgi:GT2 family glycosyltransferase